MEGRITKCWATSVWEGRNSTRACRLDDGEQRGRKNGGALVLLYLRCRLSVQRTKGPADDALPCGRTLSTSTITTPRVPVPDPPYPTPWGGGSPSPSFQGLAEKLRPLRVSGGVDGSQVRQALVSEAACEWRARQGNASLGRGERDREQGRNGVRSPPYPPGSHPWLLAPEVSMGLAVSSQFSTP